MIKDSINLFVPSLPEAVDFYRDVLDAIVIDYKKHYIKFYINDLNFTLVQESPSIGSMSAKTLGRSPLSLQVNVSNLDYSVKKAKEKGALFFMPSNKEAPVFKIADIQCSNVECPAGFIWSLVSQE